jgi:1,6-anhydro-N-acetylmuramate kinase
MDWIKTIFDPRHPVQKADRLRFHQRHRFMIGLTISVDFGQMTGCLVEGTSAGKLLRQKALSFQELPISLPMRRLFQQWCGTTTVPYRMESSPDWATYLSLRADLTQMATQMVHVLLSQAGQAADRVLAVAFHHGGVLAGSSERNDSTLPLIDAAALALKTGMNVLDQFPVKDRLEGGTGWPISALPLWLLWADRRSPRAFEHRVIIQSNSEVEMTWLPPSDGLDATYPQIQQHRWPLPFEAKPSGHNDESDLVSAAGITELVVEQIRQQIQTWQTVPAGSSRVLPAPHKLRIVVAESQSTGGMAGLQQRLTKVLPETVVVPSSDYECPAWGMGALVAATHGFLHVDQVPANLPWISGTEVPRILGTLTPGAAGRYRSLLIEMSDYRPPVMTLRDAV